MTIIAAKRPTHFRGLEGAFTLATPELLELQRNLERAFRPGHLSAIAAIGDFGSGKTFAALTVLDRLGYEFIYVKAGQALNHLSVIKRIGQAAEGIKWVGKYDELQPDLIDLLSERPRVLVIDEAHKLTPTAITELRNLLDDDDTLFALLLIGGDRLENKLIANDELDDRVVYRTYFRPLNDREAVKAMRAFHPFYADVDEKLLRYVNRRCKGRYRRWASFTLDAVDACVESGSWLTQSLAEGILDRQRPEDRELGERDLDQR